jgi:hypothetical protein
LIQQITIGRTFFQIDDIDKEVAVGELVVKSEAALVLAA